jgi:hypothetical protein
MFLLCSYFQTITPPDASSSASPAQAHDPAPDLPAACAPVEDSAARNHALRMTALEAVIDHGLGLLDEVRRRTLRQPHVIEQDKPEPADLGLTFDRISRALRFTVAQHERLEVEAGKSAEQRQAEAAARAAAEAQRLAGTRNAPSPEEQARKRERDRKLRLVERAVKRAIEDYAEEYEDREELAEDLSERLKEHEDLGLDRPIGAVVAGICRAMRLPFDLALWEDEPWALSETAEKAKGSPYARWRRSANDSAWDEEDPPRTRRGVGPP